MAQVEPTDTGDFDAYIDSLIDMGAIDDNDKLLKMIDHLPEDQKLKVMDEIEAIRNELDSGDVASAALNSDMDALDNALDKKAKRKDYREHTDYDVNNLIDNPVSEQLEIDNDNDGDPDVTITKQDDGKDEEPADEHVDNMSEENDMPSENVMQDIMDNMDNKKKLNSNVVNAVSGRRF